MSAWYRRSVFHRAVRLNFTLLIQASALNAQNSAVQAVFQAVIALYVQIAIV